MCTGDVRVCAFIGVQVGPLCVTLHVCVLSTVGVNVCLIAAVKFERVKQ